MQQWHSIVDRDQFAKNIITKMQMEASKFQF